MKKRGRNLTDSDLAKIVDIIDLWEGTLRWDGLIKAIHRETGQLYTRQALAKKPCIDQAFKRRRKARTSSSVPKARGPELEAALGRLNRLEPKMARLIDENAALLEQFVRWAYNARMRGLTLGYLSQPLPPINRDKTVIKPQRRSPLSEIDDSTA